MQDAVATDSGRKQSLDGLRGLSAAVVVLHHSLLTVPVLAVPYFIDRATFDPSEPVWWFTYTPLHLLWDGTAAVYVFFILSGVVLTLPVLKAAGSFRWSSYLPQRLIRLYLPVWAAVALAAANIALIPRGPAASPWLSSNSDPITKAAVINDLGLLTGHGFLMSPLWSLHWEILFSLLLPVLVWLAIRLGDRSLLLVPIALALIGIGAFLQISALEFLPMFVIGVVMVRQRERVAAFASGLTRRGRILVVAVACLGISLPWGARGLGVDWRTSVLLEPLAVGGAALVVICALHLKSFASVLDSRPLQFLGTISFSWYLVHEPIVIAVSTVLGPGQGAIAIPAGAATSVLVGWLFHRGVERPSHLLARFVGRRTSALLTFSLRPERRTA